MKLTKLLERVEYECINGSVDVEVADLVNDSRKAKEGSLFFCIKGAVSDGHKYAADVIAKGAKVLVVQDEVEALKDVTVNKVADSRYAMAMISAAYFDYPAEKMKVIGITGTKGNYDHVYDQIHPGKCGTQSRTDRNDRGDHRRGAYPGGQYDPGVLHRAVLF